MSDIQHLERAAAWWSKQIPTHPFNKTKLEAAILCALQKEWEKRRKATADWEEDIPPIIISIAGCENAEGKRRVALGFFLASALKKFLDKCVIEPPKNSIQTEIGFDSVRGWIDGEELTIWERGNNR